MPYLSLTLHTLLLFTYSTLLFHSSFLLRPLPLLHPNILFLHPPQGKAKMTSYKKYAVDDDTKITPEEAQKKYIALVDGYKKSIGMRADYK